MWCAATLAVDQANRHGGYRGKPFRLFAAWSENPWGTGIAQVARLVYQDRVWAIIGGIDSSTTHLAEQVVAKARLPLVNPVATDKTVNLANVPWVFSVVPGDHLVASALAAEIARRPNSDRLVLISAVDHDARMLRAEMKKALVRARVGIRYEYEFLGGDDEVRAVCARVAGNAPAIVIVLAGADDSARLAAGLRAEGFGGILFGGPAVGRSAFVAKAGRAAEGVVFPLLYRAQPERDRFAATFARRYGRVPDYTAAHTYDAVNLLIAAIRNAGLNRARIGDALRRLSPWSGVTGVVRWDGLGSNTRPVDVGIIHGGRACGIGDEELEHAPQDR